MNHLQYESSPYLLQHAHNPVDWYPWKEEALQRAKKENKPILVSIGYSTCHWCHVMERESFEDQEVAAYMNEHFINIKIDREERPDLDQIYMETCQAITGSGGWPLNCFLTPDGRPFMAGTYYPPFPSHNRPSWFQILMHMEKVFREEREKVEDQANRLLDLVKGSNNAFYSSGLELKGEDSPWTSDLFTGFYQNIKARFDSIDGGFGGAPKFPPSMTLSVLLAYYYESQDEEALQHLQFTLGKMIRGGLYDQLGGGFARYATDKAWLIPHFEKMLYDNALLLGIMADTYRETKEPILAETIADTIAFLEREMLHPEGGFFSALDADSEGVEGKYYVWAYSEIIELLGQPGQLFCEYYQVNPSGNWEGTNILWQTSAPDQFAEAKGLNREQWRKDLDEMRQTLLAERQKRIAPGLDDKILLSWNALMCTNLVKVYQATGISHYADLARKNMNFLELHFRQEDGRFSHTGKFNGASWETQYSGFLEDYAYLIEAMLAVYQLDFDKSWIGKAADLCERVLQDFVDLDSGLFYFTEEGQKDIPIRKVEVFDNASPSGNSTMLRNLLTLGTLLERPAWKKKALEMGEKMLDGIQKYPSSFTNWILGLRTIIYPPKEIAIVGTDAVLMARDLQNKRLQNYLLMSDVGADSNYPLLAQKESGPNGTGRIYICENFVCESPVSTLEEALVRLNS